MNYPLDVYEGVSQFEIEARRQTSEGKEYTLNHPQELVVNMRYKGIDSSSANSQGWERNSTYYFKELLKNHPEYFSKKNTIRIQNGESPRVDARFIQAFPQYSGFENDILIHHHVGKDGQAVAVPQSIHKGSGEIHIYENKLGITDNAKVFSDLCRTICENDPEMINHTSDQFKDSHKTTDYSEPETKPVADMHVDLEKGKQESLDTTKGKNVDEQESDNFEQQKQNDYLLQKQYREKRRLSNESSRSYYQAEIEDPVPKGIWGKIKYIGRMIWDNCKEEIIVGGIFAGAKAGKKLYYRHKSNNKMIYNKGYSGIPMTKHPREEKLFVDTKTDVLPSIDKEKRSSPQEHIVSANSQRYHTKNGVVLWVVR